MTPCKTIPREFIQANIDGVIRHGSAWYDATRYVSEQYRLKGLNPIDYRQDILETVTKQLG